MSLVQLRKFAMIKTIHIYYFSILKDESKSTEEIIQTTANTPSDLYDELCQKHQFSLPKNTVKVAINDEFKDWSTLLKNEDVIVFIPPVSGG